MSKQQSQKPKLALEAMFAPGVSAVVLQTGVVLTRTESPEGWRYKALSPGELAEHYALREDLIRGSAHRINAVAELSALKLSGEKVQ